MIYALFLGIMLSSVYMFIIGKASIRALSRVADIPNRVLYPAVLILCVFGAYAVNNTLFDVLVMMLMGVFGYAMLRLELPAAPFLIAFILGPLLEDNFRQALVLSEGAFDIFRSVWDLLAVLGPDRAFSVLRRACALPPSISRWRRK